MYIYIVNWKNIMSNYQRLSGSCHTFKMSRKMVDVHYCLRWFFAYPSDKYHSQDSTTFPMDPNITDSIPPISDGKKRHIFQSALELSRSGSILQYFTHLKKVRPVFWGWFPCRIHHHLPILTYFRGWCPFNQWVPRVGRPGDPVVSPSAIHLHGTGDFQRIGPA